MSGLRITDEAVEAASVALRDKYLGNWPDPDIARAALEAALPRLAPEPWWITTGPFTDPLCEKVAGPFASRDEALENRVRIEAYTTPVTFWVDSPERAERRSSGGGLR